MKTPLLLLLFTTCMYVSTLKAREPHRISLTSAPLMHKILWNSAWNDAGRAMAPAMQIGLNGEKKNDRRPLQQLLQWDLKLKFRISTTMNIVFSYN